VSPLNPIRTIQRRHPRRTLRTRKDGDQRAINAHNYAAKDAKRKEKDLKSLALCTFVWCFGRIKLPLQPKEKKNLRIKEL
jgi:hypothetical protein